MCKKKLPCNICWDFSCHQTKKEKIECYKLYKQNPKAFEPIMLQSPIIEFKLRKENQDDKN